MRSIMTNIFNVFSAIVIEWKGFLWKNFRKPTYNISIYKGYSFTLMGHGDITQWLYQLSHMVRYNKSFEAKTVEVFLSQLKEGNTVLDIGANIGMFSLLASRVVKEKGIVHSFEPSKDTFDILKKNIEINKCKNVKIHKLALSDLKGTLKLSTPKTKYGSDAFAYLSTNSNSNIESDNIEEIVEVIKLDNFLDDNNINRVDIIKIDIEGAELLCFKGANKLLSSNHKPIILFECLEELCKPRFNYSVLDLLKHLDSLSYDIQQFENWQWVAIPKPFSNLTEPN